MGRQNIQRLAQPAIGYFSAEKLARRSVSACITLWISMQRGRKLRRNPAKEDFTGDAKSTPC
jgi:hypothetical protein